MIEERWVASPPIAGDGAQTAVQRALEILESSGTRFLVTQAKGAETTGLEQAANIYRNICNRAGFRVMPLAMHSRKSVSGRIAMTATVCARRASRHPWILVMAMGEGGTLRAFTLPAVANLPRSAGGLYILTVY